MNGTETLDTLIHSFLDETLSPAAAAELKEWLRMDPQAMRRFVQILDMQVSLPAAAQVGRGERQTQDGADAVGLRVSSRVFRWAPVRYAAAAALLVSLGVALAVFRSKPGTPPEKPVLLARVSALMDDPRAVVIRRGQALPVMPDFMLEVGDRILFQSHGRLDIAFTDPEMKVSLSRLADLTLAAPEHFALGSGRIEVSATRRPPGRPPLRFSLAAARVELIGTRLVMSAHPHNSRIRVIEGSVSVANADGGNATRVTAGEMAWAFRGQSDVYKAVYSPGKAVEGRELFADDFETGLERWSPMILNRSDTLRPSPDGAAPFARWKRVQRDGEDTGCVELFALRSPAITDGEILDPRDEYVLVPTNLPFVRGGFVLEADVLIPPGPGAVRSFTYTYLDGHIEWLHKNPQPGAVWATDPRTGERRWTRIRVEYAEIMDDKGPWTHRFEMKARGLSLYAARIAEARPPRTAMCLVVGAWAQVDNVVIRELLTFD